jgi:hypothetical protein
LNIRNAERQYNTEARMLAVVGNIVIYQWLRLASVTENRIDRTTAGNPAGVEFSL